MGEHVGGEPSRQVEKKSWLWGSSVVGFGVWLQILYI